MMGNKISGPLWQRNYYEHIIRREESLTAVRNYIRHNPAQWDLDEENPEVGKIFYPPVDKQRTLG